MARLLFLEFNEISFENVCFYCSKGLLPHLRALIDQSGIVETRSEQAYENLEPWIQWVTAHTGLSLAEHRVFRLGDIVNHDLPQIWERLEDLGLKVGAVCPMNAKNRLRNAAFFVPDPWTPTKVSGPKVLRKLSAAASQIVNDNAQRRISLPSAVALVNGLVAYARPRNYSRYGALMAGGIRHSWKRALVLDLLLADVFTQEVRKSDPNFASLFLNAGAHIQHHYMFSSASYSGEQRNPEWYAPGEVDPVLEAYEVYDHILGQIRESFPASRIMVATGLHQVPYPRLTYYWRLKDHETFLREIDVRFNAVAPRMSRDFLVYCASEGEAAAAEKVLTAAVGEDGVPLFEVDNRGRDLFVMLIYPHDIGREFCFQIADRKYSNLRDKVAFVALKNGGHDGVGYFLDSGAARGSLPAEFELAEIPERIMHALGFAQADCAR